jgi:hypothetical protein
MDYRNLETWIRLHGFVRSFPMISIDDPAPISNARDSIWTLTCHKDLVPLLKSQPSNSGLLPSICRVQGKLAGPSMHYFEGGSLTPSASAQVRSEGHRVNDDVGIEVTEPMVGYKYIGRRL